LEDATALLYYPRLLVHAAVWLQIEGDDGVLVEYGAYEGSDGGRYGYFDTDGARFAKMTRSQFEAQFPDRILCNASKEVTFAHLTERFCGTGWRKHDYTLPLHNCQSFATEVISLTGAQMVLRFDMVYVTAIAPPPIFFRLMEQTGGI
jgi:hypothetical protein